METAAAICWFRLDLRLDDHAALRAAAECDAPVIPLFIWSPEEESPWEPGAASRLWLHHSLAALDAQLRRCDSRLILRRGPIADALRSIARQTAATTVFYHRRIEPHIVQRDEQLSRSLGTAGLELRACDRPLLFDHQSLHTASGEPFQTFTPFWNSCLKHNAPPHALPAPARLPLPSTWPDSLNLDELALDPKTTWSTALMQHWVIGSIAARASLQEFAAQRLAGYERQRDRPDLDGTSRISPHLHFGEISPRRVWHEIQFATGGKADGLPTFVAEPFLRQLGWREFAHYLLRHFPHLAERPMRGEFLAFPWRSDANSLRAWQRGQTGYPLVDAGMRQLGAIGWMHNRARMAVASFLTKDLLVSWQEGARWFWDTLVDADLANNSLGWQWTAGCAAHAAPFFRVFNPVLQGRKLDPEGVYVRRWVPELGRLPSTWVHNPWDAPAEVLGAAGVELGRTYPRPIVDHSEARRRALAAFESIRSSRSDHPYQPKPNEKFRPLR